MILVRYWRRQSKLNRQRFISYTLYCHVELITAVPLTFCQLFACYIHSLAFSRAPPGILAKVEVQSPNPGTSQQQLACCPARSH